MTWVTLATIAAFCKSFATISEKEILTKESTSNYITGVSFIIALFSLPLLYFVKDSHITFESILWIYGLSIISAIDALAIAYVIQKLDISESSALFATTPIVVALFGTLFLNELLLPLQIVGIILSSVGLFILEYKHKNKHGIDLNTKEHPDDHPTFNRKVLYTVLFVGLLCFGLSTIGDRYVIHYRGVDPLLYLLFVQVGISLNLFIYEIVRNARALPNETRLKLIDPKLLLQKSFWANVAFIIAHRVTHMFAVGLVSAGLLNAAKQTNAVISTVIGGKLFKEKELTRRTIACLVIILGVILVVLP